MRDEQHAGKATPLAVQKLDERGKIAVVAGDEDTAVLHGIFQNRGIAGALHPHLQNVRDVEPTLHQLVGGGPADVLVKEEAHAVGPASGSPRLPHLQPRAAFELRLKAFPNAIVLLDPLLNLLGEPLGVRKRLVELLLVQIVEMSPEADEVILVIARDHHDLPDVGTTAHRGTPPRDTVAELDQRKVLHAPPFLHDVPKALGATFPVLCEALPQLVVEPVWKPCGDWGYRHLSTPFTWYAAYTYATMLRMAARVKSPGD